MANHKIVNIKRSTKYSDRFIIYLDNKSVFKVTEDAFVLNPLIEGDTVSSKEIESYGKEMRFQEARDAGYRLLGFRMRSIAEMRNRLREKSFDIVEIDHVINHMLELKYLDDEAFGKAFVREKVKNKKIGPRALRSEIFPHKLPKELLEKLVNEIYEEFNVRDLIVAHLNKRKIQKHRSINNKDQKRLNNFLARKGFSWDSISDVYQEWGLI